jgi:hypothetical protein
LGSGALRAWKVVAQCQTTFDELSLRQLIGAERVHLSQPLIMFIDKLACLFVEALTRVPNLFYLTCLLKCGLQDYLFIYWISNPRKIISLVLSKRGNAF